MPKIYELDGFGPAYVSHNNRVHMGYFSGVSGNGLMIEQMANLRKTIWENCFVIKHATFGGKCCIRAPNVTPDS